MENSVGGSETFGDEPILRSAVGWLTITLGVALVYFLHWYQTSSRSYKLALEIPGPAPLPIIGNAHMVFGVKTKADAVVKILELAKEYKNVGRAFLGGKVFVFLVHPDDVELILSSHEHLDKSEEYSFFKPWLGDGLLISSGDKWRSHRKLIAPTFHINILKSFVGTFYTNSLDVVANMRQEVGKEFDVHDYMSEVTTDILLETAMGTKKQKEQREGFDYAMAVMKMCDLIHMRHYKFWYRLEMLYRMTGLQEQQDKLLSQIHGLTRRVIRTKKEKFEQNMREGKLPKPSLQELIADNESQKLADQIATAPRDDLDVLDETDVGEKRRLAFLDLMIETAHTGAEITDEEIKEEVDTIMFEGHDTTAAGSSFVLCLLGIHQNVQEKVMDELNGIFGKSGRPVTFADTLEMKYLERVILESLRLYPPVPAIARRINTDVKLKSTNCTVPAGSTVIIGTFKIHRKPEFYPNPEVFDPDNFLPERSAQRHYYSYIPFSAGPRSCVGRKYAMLKLKVLLSTILRSYKITSNIKESDFKLTADIILKRDDGFRVKIEPRVL